MIISFNPDIFNSQDDKVLDSLFRLFFCFFDDAFLWDIENLEKLFLNDDGEFVFDNNFSKSYISKKHFEKLEEKVYEAFERAAYNTKTHQKYIRNLTIGYAENQIPPNEALKLVTNPSYIVVENRRNDGRFLEGLIKNYKNFGSRSTIYTLIHEAFQQGRILPYQAGGGGELKTSAEYLKRDVFDGYGQSKLLVFFDSDRSNSVSINTKYNNLLNFLKGRNFDPMDSKEWSYHPDDDFLWHMTYKREMENYVPLTLMYQSYFEITQNLQQELNLGTDSFRDFYDFDGILNDGHKNITPGLFLNDRLVNDIENKCSHHMVKVETYNGTLQDASEIEELLIKLAMII